MKGRAAHALVAACEFELLQLLEGVSVPSLSTGLITVVLVMVCMPAGAAAAPQQGQHAHAKMAQGNIGCRAHCRSKSALPADVWWTKQKQVCELKDWHSNVLSKVMPSPVTFLHAPPCRAVLFPAATTGATASPSARPPRSALLRWTAWQRSWRRLKQRWTSCACSGRARSAGAEYARMR